MKEIQEKSILVRVSEGSSYRESAVNYYMIILRKYLFNIAKERRRETKYVNEFNKEAKT